ncbi:MAG: site-specific DNA-methyltransferase [Terriglobia bacterium]
MRPDVGTQAQFKKKKPAATYRYDSSLSPALDWDGQNSAREKGEEKLSAISSQLSVAQGKLAAVRSRLADAKKALTAADVKALTDDCKLTTENLRQAEEAAQSLKAMSKPFLNWAGKAERLSFDVPTLPLFVHERLSTKAIIETLTSHKRDKQIDMFSLFGDPQHSFTDQILRAYEYQDKWVNRMILGDSLVVMNSLLHYEGLGGQVQMIYMDPPYGVKFGSNFQPFVRKRDVSHNDDEDMTREPEMVQAYRDTWELGLHSYLTYLRDRLLLARDLLAPSGSLFVQISDENVHHVRELMDEVFGTEHFCSLITVKKTTGAGSPAIGTDVVPAVSDYLLWYSKNRELVKFRELYTSRGGEGWVNYDYVRLPDGTHRRMTTEEGVDWSSLPYGAKVYRRDNLTSTSSTEEASRPVQFNGHEYTPGRGGWKTSREGLERLAAENRLEAYGNTLAYRRFASDFPYSRMPNLWEDTVTGGYAEQRFYVVQTNSKIVQRCVLMATDPGDLVLDPTCGSGTTAYVAEQWGRRWITIDTSRVPLALSRQRLLTATFPWYELNDNARGPAGGFVYKRKQNNKGEDVGGIVPHVTLKSIANNEPPKEEVLVDRPEPDNKITRVTGAFCVEGTIPTPVDLAASEGAIEDSKIPDSREEQSTFTDRMLEILRKSPLLRLEGNRTLALKNIRPPAKTLSLSAEALVDATAPGQTPTLLDAVQEAAEKNGKALPLSAKPVALVFGPENGAISERLVQEAAKEAWLKNYTHLLVIGFAIQPNARQLIENCDAVLGIPATYIQATPDLMMGDLLKNMRSSQIFSVCGLPEIKVHRVAPTFRSARQKNEENADLKVGATMYQVELLGLDVFDPVTMDAAHRSGNDVPAWFLDTDYNGLCFHVSQAFFPRTSAWDNLKKALKSEFEESVWEHLSGTTSAPFEAGENRQIAVKVIDDRGNELMVVKALVEGQK